jgi:hypothetical protein
LDLLEALAAQTMQSSSQALRRWTHPERGMAAPGTSSVTAALLNVSG